VRLEAAPVRDIAMTAPDEASGGREYFLIGDDCWASAGAQRFWREQARAVTLLSPLSDFERWMEPGLE